MMAKKERKKRNRVTLNKNNSIKQETAGST
jgi:hypothetical protein